MAPGAWQCCAVLLLLGCLLSFLSEQRNNLSICKMHSRTRDTDLTQLGNAKMHREELTLQNAENNFCILWVYFMVLSPLLKLNVGLMQTAYNLEIQFISSLVITLLIVCLVILFMPYLISLFCQMAVPLSP